MQATNRRMALAAHFQTWLRGTRITLAVPVLLLILSACQAEPQRVTQSEPTQAPPAPATDASRPPLVTSVNLTPTNFPSFAPLHKEDMTETATAAAPASPTEPSEETGKLAEDSDGDEPPLSAPPAAGDKETAAAATPEPTFTPPALPNTSPKEHYWLQRPVAAGGTVWTDKYYPYASTRGGQLRPHHGVEFNVPYNSEILAAGSGTVIVAGSDDETAYGPHTDFYGNLVIIEHDFQYNGQPVYTLYGHLNEVQTTVGSVVASQEVIGLSGATGVADGPHMHFEVRVGSNSYGATRNPLLWLYPFPDRGTIAGRVVWPGGQLVEGAPVSLNRVDGPAPYYGTTTYIGGTVNADEGWDENFAIDDVVAGYYQVVVSAGDDKFKAETWVYPYRTSFVEITVEPGSGDASDRAPQNVSEDSG